MSTFVLIHGAFSGGWKWEKVVPLLEKAGHKVIAPDLPGHGNNLKIPPEKTTLQDCADYVAAILDEQPEPVILVGYSMGGVIVSQTAEYRPEKIKKIIYVCAFLLKDGEALSSRGGGRHNPQSASFEVFKETFYADCPDEEVRQALARQTPPTRNVATAPIHTTPQNYGRIPRMYIQTLQDKAIPPAVQKQMYTDTPCECILTMNTSHSPMVAAPAELARLLLAAADE
jgi:pimeloyl-ACP methyl ester carboxylesterase